MSNSACRSASAPDAAVIHNFIALRRSCILCAHVHLLHVGLRYCALHMRQLAAISHIRLASPAEQDRPLSTYDIVFYVACAEQGSALPVAVVSSDASDMVAGARVSQEIEMFVSAGARSSTGRPHEYDFAHRRICLFYPFALSSAP